MYLRINSLNSLSNIYSSHHNKYTVKLSTIPFNAKPDNNNILSDTQGSKDTFLVFLVYFRWTVNSSFVSQF